MMNKNLTPHRFVLHYSGADPMPPADIQYLQTQVNVLDRSRHSLLVESNVASLKMLLAALPNWQSQPETVHHLFTTQTNKSFTNSQLLNRLLLLATALLLWKLR